MQKCLLKRDREASHKCEGLCLQQASRKEGCGIGRNICCPGPLTNPLYSDKAQPTDKVPVGSLWVIHRVLFLSHKNIYISISIYNFFFIPPSLGCSYGYWMFTFQAFLFPLKKSTKEREKCWRVFKAMIYRNDFWKASGQHPSSSSNNISKAPSSAWPQARWFNAWRGCKLF